MATITERAQKLISTLTQNEKSFEQVLTDVSKKDASGFPILPEIPSCLHFSKDAQHKRLSFLETQHNVSLQTLAGITPLPDPSEYKGNIENFIGMTQIPTGIVGPIWINGSYAQGDFFVPLATSEGALVASYNRGARATRLSGGITSVCLTESVQRSPAFRFNNLPEVGAFAQWLLTQTDIFKEIVSNTSRFAKIQDLRLNIEGNQLIVIFEYFTGDAAGQNMVTLCTDAVCKFIIENSPVKPLQWFVESNYSGDKKATANSFSTVRGKKVTAEAFIKKEVVEKVLGSSPQAIAQYWQTSSVAAVQSGAIGIQGHYANGLAALFLACGQDVACVTEAYVGITRMEVLENDDLYIAVTLPSLIVGTVGGGTALPTQHECLKLLGCTGNGTARKFAEICGATVLAGELSIAAALASGDFSKSHKLFGRKR